MERNKWEQWTAKQPLLTEVMAAKPVVWQNPYIKTVEEAGPFNVTRADMEEAARRWDRFAPYLMNVFPETQESEGLVESPVRRIEKLKSRLESEIGKSVPGAFFLKCDSELPIAGSVKARGGVYEVLKFAEKLAADAGMLKAEDDYRIFAGEQFRSFFSRYTIGVGSTGNLGLSIGIMGAKLGFRVRVYMSSDAKQWKKELLRKKGAEVAECEGDFSAAVARGRQEIQSLQNGYFVDDEQSKELFLGYSVAAFRLGQQLQEQGITVDMNHPLAVYLPCGVGGAPGGITYGLKQVFGEAVSCYLVEPTHSPAMLIGLLTGELNKVSVQDFGLDNRTEADGLAVGRPSGFASPICRDLISGLWTVEDEDLFRLLRLLDETEGLFIEPSAAAGLAGPFCFWADEKKKSLPAPAAHLIWATGGDLVPEEDRQAFLNRTN